MQIAGSDLKRNSILEERIAELQNEIDTIVYDLYDFKSSDMEDFISVEEIDEKAENDVEEQNDNEKSRLMMQTRIQKSIT